jgi:hypothetical protein
MAPERGALTNERKERRNSSRELATIISAAVHSVMGREGIFFLFIIYSVFLCEEMRRTYV